MRCFYNFSLGFHAVEVICPVCALYNTKKEVGRTSAGLPPLPPACSQQTSFEHAALYWVPVCQTGSGSWWPYGTRFHTHAGNKHTISKVFVFLPIFLSRTVQFRPRRNVRASPVTVVHLGSRIRHSMFVLYGEVCCFVGKRCVQTNDKLWFGVFLSCLVMAFLMQG